MTKIDERFCPSLKEQLSALHFAYFSNSGIDFIGKPAPAEEGYRAALWTPDKFNEHGEAPVILAQMIYGETFEPYKAKWFGGIAVESLVIAAPSAVVAYAEAAIYPAPSLEQVIDLTRNMV